MNLSVILASPAAASEIARVKNAAADDLTARYGKGHWSYQCTEKSVLGGMTDKSFQFAALLDGRVVGTLQLAYKKPWAIDIRYFTDLKQAVYLTGMAVLPELQGKGIGRYMLGEVADRARMFSAGAIRLDAYDAPAGAGDFYVKCGYRETGRVVCRTVPLIYYERVL